MQPAACANECGPGPYCQRTGAMGRHSIHFLSQAQALPPSSRVYIPPSRRQAPLRTLKSVTSLSASRLSCGTVRDLGRNG